MQDVETRTISKVYRKFVPLLMICFIACFLDRVNVGFAALTMSKELNFTATIFGLGAGLFFISYFILEVPSNLVLQKVGARLWITRIMVTWGLLSAATAFIWDEWSFYGIRILLGAAEAGYFPGVILFLTYWVPRAHRGRIVSNFMVAMPLANVIGAPISGYLLTLDGLLGLRGWQLLFILEGLPSIFLAVFAYMILRDRPDDAEWLATDEREWLKTTLEQERHDTIGTVSHGGWSGFVEVLRLPIIILLSLAYFGVVAFNFGLSFFLPQIVRAFNLSLVQTGFVAALPFVAAGIGMVWWGFHSDARNERKFHLVFPLACAAVGLGLSTLIDVPVIKLALLCLAGFGVFSALPIFWTVTSSVLGPTIAAVGLAVINSVGNLSGFAAPYAVGVIKDATGSFNGGLQLIAIYGFVVIAILSYILISYRPKAAPGAPASANAG